MKKPFSAILLLLVIAIAASAQQTNVTLTPAITHPPAAATKPQAAPDPLLLTEAEKNELGQAVNFTSEAKKQFDQALSDVLNTPLERLNALEVVGRLQRADAMLQAAKQHLADVREKHKASRPDCEKCEYGPDGSRLGRPQK
jgi:hypothetical protein